jgi:hypothetical protein
MTMPKPHDWMLPVLALLVLALGGVFFKYDQRLPATVWEGRDLIAGLEPKELSKITFKTKTKTFSILRQGEGFVIDSQNLAPVDTSRLNEVLLRLGGAQISGVEGNKSDWERWNVAESNSELSLELFTQGDKPKWTVYLGKSLVGKAGRATRLGNKDEVYITKENLYIPAEDVGYVAKTAAILKKDQIKTIDVFQNGKKLADNRFIKDDLLASLDPLSVKLHLRTGALPAELAALRWDWSAQLLSESGQIYHLSWAQTGDRWFARAQAEMNQSLTTSGPVIDIKLLALKAEVDNFNQSKMGWIWELSEQSMEKLKSGLMYGSKK